MQRTTAHPPPLPRPTWALAAALLGLGLALASSARPPAASGTAPGGYALFMTLSCASCHTIRGTPAAGRVGPDLTHLASRLSLASGTLPNTPANLARWLKNPQAVKPGCLMPNLSLTDAQVRALVAFLERLQ